MDADAVLNLIGDFGPGFIVWEQRGTVNARPFFPSLERLDKRVICIADASWFGGTVPSHLDISMLFLDEFRQRGLNVRGDGTGSFLTKDIAAAWNLSADLHFSEGATRGALVALQITLRSAHLWDFNAKVPRSL